MKSEYTSIAADQRPPYPWDRDEEPGSLVTEGQHDGASNQGNTIVHREVPDENDKTLLIDGDNPECSKYGTTWNSNKASCR